MLILDIIVFIAKWILFIFPVFQGINAFFSRTNVVGFYHERSVNYPEVSTWLWIIPPLKIYLEKKRFKKIMRDSQLDRKEAEQFYNITNKAIAWLCISLAGLFEGIDATYSLLEGLDIHLSLFMFILLIVIIVFLLYLSLMYSLSERRKESFFRDYGVNDSNNQL